MKTCRRNRGTDPFILILYITCRHAVRVTTILFGETSQLSDRQKYKPVCAHVNSDKLFFSSIQHTHYQLTLSLPMPCKYGAPCKTRNFNVVYIWTHVWQRWKPSLSICCTMFQHWINAESYPVAHLCVNTLLATKVTLITDGIQFGTLRVKLYSTEQVKKLFPSYYVWHFRHKFRMTFSSLV
jgi:hypothetical protein